MATVVCVSKVASVTVLPKKACSVQGYRAIVSKGFRPTHNSRERMENLSKYSDQSVTFAAGVRHDVRRYVERLDTKGVLVLCTPGQSGLGQDLADALGPLAAGVFAKAAMHTPVDITEDALEHLDSVGAACVLSVGGGSTIGLGKALRLRRDVRHIALPTTYAGSECTPILGQTEDGRKTTMQDDKLRPDIVLYDPELVVSLPPAMTVTSALNAMAHAVEALYAEARTAASDDLAMLGLRAFHTALPRVMEDPADVAARLDTQRGTWACGTVLGRVGMALHHKLCHTLGGSFGLPHAQTHAIVLPHATAYNAPAARDALAPVAQMFDADDVGLALWEFARALYAPLALRDLGLTEADLDRAADLASENPYWNPRPITRDGIRALLGRAWVGARPLA